MSQQGGVPSASSGNPAVDAAVAFVQNDFSVGKTIDSFTFGLTNFGGPSSAERREAKRRAIFKAVRENNGRPVYDPDTDTLYSVGTSGKMPQIHESKNYRKNRGQQVQPQQRQAPASPSQQEQPVSFAPQSDWTFGSQGGEWNWRDAAGRVVENVAGNWLNNQLNPQGGAGSWQPVQSGGGYLPGIGFNPEINLNMPDWPGQQQPDPSWWERILDKVIDGVGGGIGTAVGTATTRVADGFLGNPSPGQLAGQYFSDAFPGTNPWERLGSQAAQAGTQQKLKQQELATRVHVARIAAQAQVQAAKESARPGLKRAEAQNPLDEARTRQVEAHIQPQIAKWSAEEKLALQQAKLILQQTDIAKTDAFYRALEKETGIDKNRFGYLLPILNTLDMDPNPELTPMGDALRRGDNEHDDFSRALAKAIVGVGIPAGFAIRYAAQLKQVAGFLMTKYRGRPKAVEKRRVEGEKARRDAVPQDSGPNDWQKY